MDNLMYTSTRTGDCSDDLPKFDSEWTDAELVQKRADGLEWAYAETARRLCEHPITLVEWAADWWVWRVMDLASILSYFVWSQRRTTWIPEWHVHENAGPTSLLLIGFHRYYPPERWCYCKAVGWKVPDGWRLGRCV